MTRYATSEELDLWYRVARTSSPAYIIKVPPQFNSTLDLHFYTVQAAYDMVARHLTEADTRGVEYLLHITGRSGIINQEYEHWVKNHPMVRSVVKMNGGGAWKIRLRKK